MTARTTAAVLLAAGLLAGCAEVEAPPVEARSPSASVRRRPPRRRPARHPPRPPSAGVAVCLPVRDPAGPAGRRAAPVVPEHPGDRRPRRAGRPVPRVTRRRARHRDPEPRTGSVAARPGRWRRARRGRQLHRHRAPHVARRAVPRPAVGPPGRPPAGAPGGCRLRLRGDRDAAHLVPVGEVEGPADRTGARPPRRDRRTPDDHAVHLRHPRGPRSRQLLGRRVRQPRAPDRQDRRPHRRPPRPRADFRDREGNRHSQNCGLPSRS